jgi:glucose-6-phosphate isomerase/transaldolase/glucose-6-phosphate isomerase
MLAEAEAQGSITAGAPALEDDALAVYGDSEAETPALALRAFTEESQPPAYVALMAYVQPMPEIDEALLALRLRLRDPLGVATTAGYGPRFLHSTGQLHKGDAGHGLFVQFTEEPREDAPIPDAPGEPASSVTFGTLILAQALGDNAALQEAGRRVIRVHIKGDTAAGLRRLEHALQKE